MEKIKQNEVIINVNDFEKYDDLDSSTESEEPQQERIELHWSFEILVYLGFFKTKYRYQILFVTTFYTFIVWIHKLYEDIGQAVEYNDEANSTYFAISIVMLTLPTFMCTIYLLLDRTIDTQCRLTRHDIVVTLINGIMLVPWQARTTLNTLYYASQRICHHVWTTQEKEKVFKMGIDSDLLEFFEDMFSGFLGVCLQIYIMMVNFGWTGEEKGETKIIYGELIGSALSLLSMVEAIKRNDDCPLNAFMVRLGWIFMFCSRALAFCLAITIIKFWIILIILVHVIAMNCWIYHIAHQSYIAVICNDEEAILDWKIGFGRGRSLLWLLSFILYGIPSIIYWPLMLEMKDDKRAHIFLAIIFIENFCLAAIWTFGVNYYEIKAVTEDYLLYTNLALLMLTLLSIFWIYCYLLRKPYNSDRLALFKILQQNPKAQAECAIDYGVSYIFYSKIFALPSLPQLMKTISPYCYENRLLFAIDWDGSDDDRSDDEANKPLTEECNKYDNKLEKSKKKIVHFDQSFNGLSSPLSGEISDADDEDESDDNTKNTIILYARATRHSRSSLSSLSD